MPRIRNAAATALLGAALLCVLSACGDPEPTVTPIGPTATNPPTFTPSPPTPTPLPPTPTVPLNTPTPTIIPSGVTVNGPAGELLSKSVLAMRDVKSYHFAFENTVARTTGSVTAQGEGDFAAPDKRRVSMKIGSQGTTEFTSIGSDMYYQMPGSKQYLQLSSQSNPLGSAGAATTALDPSMIAQSMDSAEIVGDETVDGINTTHVKFTYDIDKAINLMTKSGQPPASGKNALGKAGGEMWVAKDTGYVHKILITPTQGGTPGTTDAGIVQATFSKYNEPVDPPIEKPTNFTNLPPGDGSDGDAGP